MHNNQSRVIESTIIDISIVDLQHAMVKDINVYSAYIIITLPSAFLSQMNFKLLNFNLKSVLMLVLSFEHDLLGRLSQGTVNHVPHGVLICQHYLDCPSFYMGMLD